MCKKKDIEMTQKYYVTNGKKYMKLNKNYGRKRKTKGLYKYVIKVKYIPCESVVIAKQFTYNEICEILESKKFDYIKNDDYYFEGVNDGSIVNFEDLNCMITTEEKGDRILFDIDILDCIGKLINNILYNNDFKKEQIPELTELLAYRRDLEKGQKKYDKESSTETHWLLDKLPSDENAIEFCKFKSKVAKDRSRIKQDLLYIVTLISCIEKNLDINSIRKAISDKTYKPCKENKMYKKLNDLTGRKISNEELYHYFLTYEDYYLDDENKDFEEME